MDESPGAVPMRIGDVERREVDARLQQAVGDGLLTLGEYDERAALVWQSRTRDDLQAVTRDLPGPAPVERAPAVPARRGRRPPARRVLAVMSGDQMQGPVAADQDVQAYAVMGEAVLDLRRTDMPAEVRVRAVAVMGNVRLLVPRGTAVHLSGVSLMGARELRLDPPRSGAPVVDLTGYALMGAVEVTHGTDGAPAAGAVPAAAGVDLHKRSAPQSLAPRPGHSVRVHEPRHPYRGRLLLGVGALALAGYVGFHATGQDASAVFGSTVYTVPASQHTVHVGTMFGSVKVVVPNDAQVSSSGGVAFGSLECPSACDPRPAGGPSIRVKGAGGFGSIQVVTQSEEKASASDDGG